MNLPRSLFCAICIFFVGLGLYDLPSVYAFDIAIYGDARSLANGPAFAYMRRPEWLDPSCSTVNDIRTRLTNPEFVFDKYRCRSSAPLGQLAH